MICAMLFPLSRARKDEDNRGNDNYEITNVPQSFNSKKTQIVVS